MDWVKTHKVWSAIIGILLLLVIIGAMLGDDKKSENQKTTQPTPQTQTPAQTTPPKPTYTFNVPTLVGKNIDQIRKTLGKPTDGSLTEPNAAQKKLGVTEWDNTFKKNGQELLVTFNPETRMVIDFFIGSDNYQEALKIANVTDNDSHYKVEAVKAIKDPSQITGIKVTPNR